MTPEEKKQILERLTIENDIRKNFFSVNDKKESKSWFNSNIAILLIGSLLTGVLIPIFQLNQKRIEWKRQNQYENYKENIENKEKFLKEFIHLSTFTSEIQELSINMLRNDSVDTSSYNDYEILVNKIQLKRYSQNAELLFLLIFIDNQNISDLFNKFIVESDKYIISIKLKIKKYCKSPESVKYEEELNNLTAKIIPINELFRQITDMVFIEIKRVKNENKKLHM